MDQPKTDQQQENFILQKAQSSEVGKILIGSYWLLSRAARHQTILAGSTLKQKLLETLSQGSCCPYCQCPTPASAGELSFPWPKTSQTLMMEKGQTAPELRPSQPNAPSQLQPKPHAERNRLLWEVCFSQQPPKLPRAAGQGLSQAQWVA